MADKIKKVAKAHTVYKLADGKTRVPGTTTITNLRISSVQDADRILVLEDGAVSGFAPHEELLKTNEIYQEIYETQTQGGGDFDRPEQIGGDQV